MSRAIWKSALTAAGSCSPCVAMRADDYHLYEMNADGSGLRQLTFGCGVSDIDPIYLPDGRILFTSTREPKFCMCNRHIMCNLFTMDADGANIQQIGHSTLLEGHPSLLPDGRVIYDRWEYVDRNFGDAQGAWVCNPDGTNHAIYWGNNTNSPGAVLDNRAIPGTNLFVARSRPATIAPGERWPSSTGNWGWTADHRWCAPGRPTAIDLVGRGTTTRSSGSIPSTKIRIPLSDQLLLCARTIGKGEQMGIFLIDLAQGSETLLHAEAPGCFDPMPLAPRPRAAGDPVARRSDPDGGYFYVADVYRGHGDGVDSARDGQVAPSGRIAGEAVLDRGRLGRRDGSASAGHGLGRLQQQADPGHRRRSRPTAASISQCRPIGSSTSSCWTSRA